MKLLDFDRSLIGPQYLNVILGTPMYMAPEMRYLDFIDFSIDMWNLGILLYEIAYSTFPYQLQKIKTDEFPIYDTLVIHGNCTIINFEGIRAFDNLLHKLIDIDETLRISASDLLKHPWITGVKPVSQILQQQQLPSLQQPSLQQSSLQQPSLQSLHVSPQPSNDTKKKSTSQPVSPVADIHGFSPNPRSYSSTPTQPKRRRNSRTPWWLLH